MIFPQSFRQGDTGIYDQNGSGCVEKWTSVSPPSEAVNLPNNGSTSAINAGTAGLSSGLQRTQSWTGRADALWSGAARTNRYYEVCHRGVDGDGLDGNVGPIGQGLTLIHLLVEFAHIWSLKPHNVSHRM
jgi:hypothetical protein